MEFEQAVTLLSMAGLIIATFLIHRSVPASMWDKGIAQVKEATTKTKTPLDDMLVELLVLLRGMQQSQEPKPAETTIAVPNGTTTISGVPPYSIVDTVTNKTVTLSTQPLDTVG